MEEETLPEYKVQLTVTLLFFSVCEFIFLYTARTHTHDRHNNIYTQLSMLLEKKKKTTVNCSENFVAYRFILYRDRRYSREIVETRTRWGISNWGNFCPSRKSLAFDTNFRLSPIIIFFHVFPDSTRVGFPCNSITPDIVSLSLSLVDYREKKEKRSKINRENGKFAQVKFRIVARNANMCVSRYTKLTGHTGSTKYRLNTVGNCCQIMPFQRSMCGICNPSVRTYI